ncbi:MAG: peroxide stress protein YaaA [Segniliparus sp.]|uniref:peroxide stress protein YaaA n=1 Tax=Segniliparus sp. TaxID=2804064 RepID=UPI003F3C36CD
MLILLPPSETKDSGGDGPPVDLGALWLPELADARRALVDALTRLSADVPATARALGISEAQAEELAQVNAALWSSPTRPALARYTGVLYDALAVATLTKAQRAKADARLAIGSALFGVVGAGDQIPSYRLSAGSKLPGFGTLAAHWKPVLEPALANAGLGLVVDLRSGGYHQLGKASGAITATVVTERADGSRSVVSHFNKHHKGLLARALATTRAEPADLKGVAAVARKAGLRVETPSATELVIVT